MDIYRELILDHYHHPRHFGHMDNPDVTVEDGNVSCGDRIIIEIKINQSVVNGSRSAVISDIRFSGDGCAISQASASMLMEKVLGQTVESVLAIKTEDIIGMLGTELTPSRIKCAVLPLEVLQKAVTKV